MRRVVAGIMAVAMVCTLIPSVSVSADNSKQILTNELLINSGRENESFDNQAEDTANIRLYGEEAQALAGAAAVNEEYHDGKYTASAEGYHGTDFGPTGGQIMVSETVKATVTIVNKKITAIDIEFIGNDGVMAAGFKQQASAVINKIIDVQSTEGVDTVTGATSTSKGILGAVRLALEKSKAGSPFEDGTYVTESFIWKTAQDTYSMAASVLEPLTVFEVKDGKPTVTFSFKETIIATMQSYITDLGYFKSKEDLDAYNAGDKSKLIKGKVVETMKIQTANGEVEAPKKIQFDFDNFNDAQYVFLFSNVMNSDARFKINYDSATPYKAVESVQISETELLLNEEQTVKVSATVLPSDATNAGVIWSSSDDSIVTVDENGVITARKAGSVEVRATANNGIYGTVSIQVKTPELSYEKTGETTVALTGASEDSSYLKVPEKVKIDGNEYTVTSIAENAFKNNARIRTLILPETITEIGAHALEGTNLGNINLTNSVEKVGDYAFANISTLEKAILSSELKELGEGAFKNCSSLSEIEIPSLIRIIKAETFAGCGSLTNVVLNDGLESIETKAFHLNSSLNSLIIPASVTSIGKQAFARNVFLSHIEIKGEQVKIGVQAFSLHGKEAQLLVPKGSLTFYQNSLKEAGYTGDVLETGLTYTYNEYNETAQVTGYTGETENLIIPEVTEKDGKEYLVTSMADEVFKGNQSIHYVEVAGSVETISQYAFANCDNLEEVVLKEGVRALASCSFLDDKNLKKISIPDSLKNFSGQSIFSGTSLDSLDIPDGTTAIGYRLLAQCTEIRSINIPESVTNIGQYAFNNTNIEELTIPKNVKTIQANILSGNTSIKKIIFKGKTVPSFTKNALNNIPETVKVIVPAGTKEAYTKALTAANYKGTVEEAEAIDFIYSVSDNYAVITGYTGKMETAEIPSAIELEGKSYPVQTIASGAFKNNTDLKEIIIPDSVKNIGSEAFAGCTNVKIINVTAMTAIPQIDKDAFSQIPESALAKVPTKSVAEFKKALTDGNFKGSIEGLIRYEIADGKAILSSYEEDNSEVTIPSQIEIDGTIYEVNGMKMGVFQNNTKITSVILPDTIAEIPSQAFSGATNLESVTLPKNLVAIGDRAFYLNSALTDLSIPKSINRIENDTFNGCSALTSLELPDQLTYIGANAFSKCSKITQMNLPKSLIYIGEGAFDKTAITEVVIPEKITELSNNLFSNSALNKITLPKNLKSVGDLVFSRTQLEDIVLPESVESIGKGAFSYTKLAQIKIPDKIQSISENLFSGCSSLIRVEMSENVKSIGSFAFQSCTSLADQTIFEHITDIGAYAFSKTGYESVVISAKVATMGRSIFTNSEKLKSVKFENSMTEFPQGILQSCTALESVELPENLEKIGSYAFNNATALKKLVIPHNVEEISANAFSGMSSLETIVFKSLNLKVLGAGIFNKLPTTVIAVVPEGTKENYQSKLEGRNFPGTIQAQILDLKLDETSFSIVKNTTRQLNVPTPADDVEDKTLQWESSDNHIATVSDTGLVTAVSAGKTTITVSASNGVSASVIVYVTDSTVEAEKIVLSHKTVALEEGSTFQVIGSVTPENATDRQLSWSSSDPAIATVDSEGNITAVASGTAVITAKTSNGKTEEVNVTVKPSKLTDGVYRVPVKLLNETSNNASMANGALNPEAVLIVNGEKTDVYITLKGLVIGTITGHVSQGWYFETKDDYTAYKQNADDKLRKDFQVNSYFQDGGKVYPAQSILTISTGMDEVYLQVYVDAMGSTPYTRLSIDYSKAEAITKVDAESVKIEQQDIHLKSGETVKLSAVTTPEETTLEENFTWESDDAEIASVDEKTGVVTAKKDGTTKIFVYTKGNLTAETVVTVVSKEQEAANQTALKLVDEINELPDSSAIRVTDIESLKNSIQKISEQYAALNERAQALVTNISKLEPLKNRIEQLEKANSLAGDLDREIEELPKAEQITAENVETVKEKVALLKGRYDALEKEAKEMVTKREVLTQAETRIAQVEQGIKDAKELDELIQKLPASESIDFSNVSEVKAEIQKIRERYNALSEEDKKLVTQLVMLSNIEKKVSQIEVELSQVDAIKKKLETLHDTDQINYANINEIKQQLNVIETEYQRLSDAAKALVDNYSIISSVEQKIAQVEASVKEGSKVVDFINKTPKVDKNTSPADWEKVISAVEEAQKQYEQLDTDGKGVVHDKYEELISQIEKVNHETEEVKIPSGLAWYHQITTNTIDNKDSIYQQAKQKADSEQNNVLTVVEIDIKDLHDNTKISQLGEKVTVTVKIPEKMKAYDKDSIIVLHYKEGKLIEELKGVDNGDGTISFETDSFSTYAILAAEKVEQGNQDQTESQTESQAEVTDSDNSQVTNQSASQSVETGDTNSYHLGFVAALLSLAVLAGVSFNILLRRKRRK